MKLSEKRKSELYDAIREPIMGDRTAYQRGEITNVDNALFRLELEIWKRVKRALNLEGEV